MMRGVRSTEYRTSIDVSGILRAMDTNETMDEGELQGTWNPYNGESIGVNW